MQAFVARQPIFDRALNVFGYELLFRSGATGGYTHTDGDAASSAVISDSLLTIGIPTLTGGKRAFINFTQSILLQELADLLPPELIVVEILETVEPTPNVLRACRTLKEGKYLIALDDLDHVEAAEPFIEHLDIIKVDFALADMSTRRECVRRYSKNGIQLLAEKVETQQEYEQAQAMGYHLFQGYFFSEPKIVSHQRITEAQPMRLALLQAAQSSEVDFGALEKIIKNDVGLTYRLLKYINSAFFGVREKVHSIKQALVLLGLKNVRRWSSLIAIEAMNEGKPSELLRESLTRAYFCELLAPFLRMQARRDDLFLLGMFSLLDAILDQPMPSIVDEIPLSEEIRQTLLGKQTHMRQALDLAISYQHADWVFFAALRDKIGLDEEQIPPLYYKALALAEEICQTSDMVSSESS